MFTRQFSVAIITLATIVAARAEILSHPPLLDLDYEGTALVTQSFNSGTVPWNSLIGDYSVTDGDLLSLGGARGADGLYLRIFGEDCNNLFSPNDCKPSEGVQSHIDVSNIAGSADAYYLTVSLDVVAEGDLDDGFQWEAPANFPRSWHAGLLEPACLEYRDELLKEECIEFADDPILDYSGGQMSTWSLDFWMTNVMHGSYNEKTDNFTQYFYSSEGFGLAAIDGFWGIDNLAIEVDSYSLKLDEEVDSPPDVSVPEPRSFILLTIGLFFTVLIHKVNPVCKLTVKAQD